MVPREPKTLAWRKLGERRKSARRETLTKAGGEKERAKKNLTCSAAAKA